MDRAEGAVRKKFGTCSETKLNKLEKVPRPAQYYPAVELFSTT